MFQITESCKLKNKNILCFSLYVTSLPIPLGRGGDGRASSCLAGNLVSCSGNDHVQLVSSVSLILCSVNLRTTCGFGGLG